ncbi:ABC transporter ATP-binding protein [Rhizorhapis suberifaciens]|uniref:Lipoprotein-releasing system ATP-binding protein n=1 Tax=Rhizorhapis suberifaciens TaxID=13656 RepID=A0A840HVE5_9SPHN|nr:ABC transporter ATP-binding protein [Rhizorhapis suberifaciens]MBB4641933.1 lipoprotein-releasing system ATP-binding protein [Rhizorhapis suberifaciens]
MSGLLEAQGLTRILPGEPPVTLVRDASLKVEKGSFTAIVGPSGCGKSSLLYLLGLIDRPSEGKLLISHRDVTLLNGDERAQLRLESIGFVFQFHFLLPEFTAMQNILLPMRKLGRLSRDAADARALQLLEWVGLREKAGKTPDRMSGGERQRVAIARALANDPAIILGDEPTGNLDSENSKRVVEIFQMLAGDQDRAVLCVTHDMDVAGAADVRINMLDGRIIGVEQRT